MFFCAFMIDSRYVIKYYIPSSFSYRFYSILDMSQGLIFIHVSNPRSADHGTLYTSGSNGTVFSKSLDRNFCSRITHSPTFIESKA